MVIKSIKDLAKEVANKPDGTYYLIKTETDIFFDDKVRNIGVLVLNKKTYNYNKISKIIYDSMRRVTKIDLEGNCVEYYEILGYNYNTSKNITIKYDDRLKIWSSNKQLRGEK